MNGIEESPSAQAAGIRSAAQSRKVSRQRIDRQRAEFLRSCRARINPADLGLPEPQRKRTGGLRREDVAALSGVSVSWYTWLEQGRDMRVSEEMLERLCQTFRLSEDERVYLFSLVQHRPPRLRPELRFEAPAEIERMIHGVGGPAIIMNLCWDVLAWNRLNTLILRDYAAMPPSERNLMELLFSRPSPYGESAEFENMARRVLATLRADYSRCADEPRFEALIRRLSVTSPTFRRMWRASEVNMRSYGIHRFTHPQYGPLAFEHTSYLPYGYPSVRVVICMPCDADTQRVVAQIESAPVGT
jgi:transcriptional regulator with XRE-family HTH domain